MAIRLLMVIRLRRLLPNCSYRVSPQISHNDRSLTNELLEAIRCHLGFMVTVLANSNLEFPGISLSPPGTRSFCQAS